MKKFISTTAILIFAVMSSQAQNLKQAFDTTLFKSITIEIMRQKMPPPENLVSMMAVMTIEPKVRVGYPADSIKKIESNGEIDHAFLYFDDFKVTVNSEDYKLYLKNSIGFLEREQKMAKWNLKYSNMLEYGVISNIPRQAKNLFGTEPLGFHYGPPPAQDPS